MERLTKRSEDGGIAPYARTSGIKQDAQWLRDVIEKLAEYEDLEEQGLLLRLPCKVGTPVHEITYNTAKCYNCLGLGGACYMCVNLTPDMMSIRTRRFSLFMVNDFGKTVFLTKEEAEAKLKELEGEE